MKPVEYHPFAQEELIHAAEYYEAKVEGLGQRFLDEVDLGLADIAVSPQRWSYFHLNTRRRLLDRFPYMLVYVDEADRIYILATMHQKRRPGYWKKRILPIQL